jgi:hypothetical protein
MLAGVQVPTRGSCTNMQDGCTSSVPGLTGQAGRLCRAGRRAGDAGGGRDVRAPGGARGGHHQVGDVVALLLRLLEMRSTVLTSDDTLWSSSFSNARLGRMSGKGDRENATW